MEQNIDNLVVEFFNDLFQRVFSDNFKSQILQRRKIQEVTRQIQRKRYGVNCSLGGCVDYNEIAEI